MVLGIEWDCLSSPGLPISEFLLHKGEINFSVEPLPSRVSHHFQLNITLMMSYYAHRREGLSDE
jgi:hypothetical protein